MLVTVGALADDCVAIKASELMTLGVIGTVPIRGVAAIAYFVLIQSS